MLVTLKVLHLLAMAIGVGFGVMKAILGARMKRLGTEAAVESRALQGLMGKIGLGALAVIWTTGILLLIEKYAGHASALDKTFHTKMAFVVIFTIASLFAFFASMRGRATGRPPNVRLMAYVGTGGLIALVLAVVFAVMTFGA